METTENQTTEGTETKETREAVGSPLLALILRLAEVQEGLRQNPPQTPRQVNRVVTGTVLEGVIEGFGLVEAEFESMAVQLSSCMQRLSNCEFMSLPPTAFLRVPSAGVHENLIFAV